MHLRRGRCIQNPGFVQIAGVKADDLVNIGATLLTSVSAYGSRDENCFNVEGAFYPLCPFQESFCLELYTFTDETVRNVYRRLRYVTDIS